MAILEVKNLGLSLSDGKRLLDNVSLSLEKGQVLGIVGESGSGKSLTALSVLGLLPPQKFVYDKQAEILFEGENLLKSTEMQQVRGDKIALIFQEPMSSLNPLHKIGRQIAETLILHRGFNGRQAKAEALRLLKMTGIKNARRRMEAYPFELSGGQRQRVMIAMAMANNPEILIADEPTTALDVTVQKQIIDLLLDLKKKTGMAIIFISHDLRLVRKIADNICVMKDGKVIETGSAEELFKCPRESYTKKLVNSFLSLKNNKIFDSSIVLKAEKILVEFVLKRSFWGRPKNILKAVDSVSFELKKGKTLGIVGESGSGKTTLGLAVANLIPYSGKVEISGISGSSSKAELRKKVQIVFQDPYNSLNPRMNIGEIVGEGLQVHFSDLPKSEKNKRIINALREVGLDEDVLVKYPHEFSGGQRQRIAIARALVLEPEIVILDEPTSALDVTIQKQVMALLQEIQKKKNISYIFISHDMAAVRAIADDIAVMRDGKIVEMSSCERIFTVPQQEYTKELIAASL